VKNLTVIIFLLLTVECIGQHSIRADEHFMGLDEIDTLDYRVPRIDTIASLNNIEENYQVIDTLTNPDGYILKSMDEGNTPQHITIGGQANFILAIKRKNYFLAFSILGFGEFGDVRTERISFGDSTEKKLLVYYSYQNGFSFNSKGNAYSEHGEGFQLWDLKEIKLLFRFRRYYTYKRWDNYKVTEKVCVCENFDVKISGQIIELKELNTCNRFDESLKNKIENPGTISYLWTPTALIKRK
jgi:hypothetical protein